MLSSFLTSILVTALAGGTTASSCTSQLPVVDLGYTRQRASDFDKNGTYYTFSNIAYARPPVGNLRFAPPQPLSANQSIQQGALTPKMCPQGTPSWLAQQISGASEVPKDPNESEDCLYLDVSVPKKTLDGRKSGKVNAPVLVWIHGGGFVLGSKGDHSPAGLLAQQKAKDEGMIYVTLNYRLGAFGFLGGSQFKEQSGALNAGLLDQRAALNWIAKYIGRFGGDPSRIHLIGESGGATSIVFHQAADSSRFGKLAVKGAIYQSTAEIIPVTDKYQNDVYSALLHSLGVSDLNGARGVDTETIQTANRRTITAAAYGNFVFSVDFSKSKDNYIRNTVHKSILENASLEVTSAVVGYNLREGLIFVKNDTTPFSDLVHYFLRNASPQEHSYIETSLYPPTSNTSNTPTTVPYTTEQERKELFAAELLFNCASYAVEKAYNARAFAYRFAVPPGYHTQDIAYTFYTGASNTTRPPVVASVATALQKYITDFAVTGSPNSAGAPQMPVYGGAGNLLNLAPQGFTTITDPSKNARCEYWIQR